MSKESRNEGIFMYNKYIFGGDNSTDTLRQELLDEAYAGAFSGLGG